MVMADGSSGGLQDDELYLPRSEFGGQGAGSCMSSLDETGLSTQFSSRGKLVLA